MAQYYGFMVLQRIIFPIILTFCVLFRPILLSLPYLLLLFYLPFVPIASEKTVRGHTGYYFIVSIVVSAIIVLLQVIFQIVLVALGDQILPQCEFLEILFRHIGMIKFNELHIFSILEWCLPDILMLITTVAVYIILRKVTGRIATDAADGSELNDELVQTYNFEEGYTPENFVILRKSGVFLAMMTILLAAALRPSIPGGIYFLVFLGAATWWACCKELERGFAIVCRILLVFLAIHILSFLCYQTPWPQQYLSANDTIIRFLGFSALIISNCDPPDNDIRIFNFNTEFQADSYLNPVAILLCYYTLAIISGFLLNAKPLGKKMGGAFTQLENGTQRISQQVSLRMKKQAPTVRKKIARETWHGAADKVRELEQIDSPSEPNERTPLMRRSMKKLKTFKQFQKKVSDPNADPDDIPLDEIPGEGIPPSTEEEEDLSPTIFEHIYFGVGQFGDFIFKNSYILTNITMMVWSIVYHSWITFVFLLWANLLWIIPNQRKNMLRCCPFIVIYAELLLLAQYIYGMNLTEDELPSKMDMHGIKMSQIGFVRYDEYPCGPLLLKSVFTMIFWITLRQMTHETKLQKQTSTLAHLAAPFQVTVGAATTDLGPKLEEKKSKLMMKAGTLLKTILVQLWIWIVMLALFLCAIYGKQMTAFRITYMALFLIFLITFQFSWRLWKKIMYTFLVIVIGFAMLTLIMIYTYQFDRFNEYWTNYTGIPESLQHDIGMEKYETKDLFLNLVSPTIVVIITVVQLQYFHKKYLETFNLPLSQRRENADNTTQHPSSVNYGTLEIDSITECTKTKTNSKHFKLSDIKNITSKDIIAFINRIYDKTKWVIEIIWLFLEIHLIKIILLIGFSLGMKEVSVIHILLILLATFAVTARTNIQTIFSRIISMVIGILLIVKMIYQIQYIDHNKFDYSCNDTIINDTITINTTILTNSTMTFNDADWLGFRKIDFVHNQTLATLLQGYIAYIFITTIHALILFRQKRNRYINGKPMTRPKVIFARITRQDADKDLSHMIKYLFNFAFYKFGIEITLMMIVALIGTRMDIIAFLYAFWLCILFLISRKAKAKIWPVFKWFIVIFLIIQYVVLIGLPPSLCFDYEWKTVILQHLQEWGWLPDIKLRTQSEKLLLDFLLLLFTCRQMLVFRIEQQYENSEADFPGGSNKSVIDDINNLGKTPLTSHDFITFTRNWLDIIKCGILLGLFWFTLAIVFLTGTNRVNIFSIGYLIGSFIFLWQGADFYLRPINVILKWWRYLLGYNILVITLKAILQIPGCIFIQQLQPVCWVIQLFGICCIRKFNKTHDPSYVLEHCSVPSEDIGLVWDGICFGFLLIQLRLFQSYYFCHIINEAKASTILASRGAELIEQLRKKQVKLQAQREEEILDKIKQKMDRIKANQQKLQPTVIQPKTHYQEGTAPLARTTSLSSCAGYHTPIEDEVAGEAASDLPSDLGGLTPYGAGSILTTQAISPSSAILTVSLDGYLEPHRLSFGSPPGSELMPHMHSSDESYPVFSPVPIDEQNVKSNTIILEPSTRINNINTTNTTTTNTTTTTAPSSTITPSNVITSLNQHTLQPGSHHIQLRQHRRQSSLNTVSWTDQGDIGNGGIGGSVGDGDGPIRPIRPLSNEIDQVELRLRRRPSHRRQSSMGISWITRDPDDLSRDDGGGGGGGDRRRRFSYASWVHDVDNNNNNNNDDDEGEEVSTRVRIRPYSWGPIGEFYYRESLCFSEMDRSPISHQEYIDAFDDIDNKSKPLLKRFVSHPNAFDTEQPKLFNGEKDSWFTRSRMNTVWRYEAVRSGDYYLFEDLDEKVELDLIHQRPSASVEDTLPGRRLSHRMTIDQVLDQKMKQQRRKLASDTSVIEHGTINARRSSFPEEHELTTATTTIDPRSTVSEPITRGGEKSIIKCSDDIAHQQDEFTQPDGQQPSTSRAAAAAAAASAPTASAYKHDIKDDLSDPTSSTADDDVSGFAFIRAFLSGVLVSITLKLYKLSRNYRYVTRVLSKEKKELKAEKDFGQGHRIGTGNVWTPLPSALRTRGDSSIDVNGSSSSGSNSNVDSSSQITKSSTRNNEIVEYSDGEADDYDDDGKRIVKEESRGKKGEKRTTIAQLLRPTMFSTRDQKPDDDELRRTSLVPEIRILAPSMERGLDDSIQKSDVSVDSSQKDLSEADDDFYSQEHSVVTELFTSIWFAMISNTDLICYLFVFIHMVASASLLALPIPIMVFLWGTLSVPRPSKTFWVTIIAYTQIVVLLKSFCQFGILWWNDVQLTPNQPLAPSRIIGVEKKSNYADYDLALLLVVFFHRFVQKQMGIWRTGTSDDNELEGTYTARVVPSGKDIIKEPTTMVKQGDLRLALRKTEFNDEQSEDATGNGGAIVKVSNVNESQSNYFPKVAALSTKKYFSSFTIFFKKLLKQANRVTADVYVYIFLCDFINFFVLLFGFTAFGSTQGDGGVASYLTENKIPLAFLFMLLLQFVFIIVDRALYLRKNLAGKIMFQFISVIGMHIWLFFLVPVFSERSFNAKSPPVIYYIVKCFYFLFSAYQIRCGYPRRILGNCLTKGFSIVNLGAFKVYMATPFLFELRALMDWIWTDSSMPLFEWLKMEDIFANIYELKCSRQMEKKFPAPRGQAKGSFIKYIMGGGFLFAIIAFVWGPLALFALGNTVGEPNVPYEVKVSLKIGSYEPLYIMGAQSSQIHQFREENWAAMQRVYSKNRVALTFLSSYEYNDIAAVVLGPNSTSLWMITPPDLDRLKDDLKNNVTLKFRYKYSASRISYNEKMAPTIFGDQAFDLNESDPSRMALIDMLDGKNIDHIVLPHLFPKFLKISYTNEMLIVSELNRNQSGKLDSLLIKLHSDVVKEEIMWWEILEENCKNFIQNIQLLLLLPYENCYENVVFYIFFQKNFPSTWNWLTAGGIIGIYSTFVFFASTVFRRILAGSYAYIIFTELPNVDRILQLCQDIYLVREFKEFQLEEDLFAKVLFLYRSPKTMIQWTSEQEIVSNQGDLTSIPQLFPEETKNVYRNLFLQMHTLNRGNITTDSWWAVLEDCNDAFYMNILSNLSFADCSNNLVLYTFSDKLFPATLSFLTAGGVIGLYTTFVFVMSRFFRGLFAGGCKDIMYSELPYVDRILQLCLDIYLVRESMEFDLEEDLFAKLIFVYRSPETMIRWTRPIEEQSSDEEEDGDDDDDDATDADNNFGRTHQQKQLVK